MRTAFSRDIMFFDLDVSPDPGDAPTKSMEQFGELARKLRDARLGVQLSRDGERKLRLAQVAPDPDHQMLWLLLYSTNRSGSEAAYAHMETDAHRTAGKQEGEGRAEAAHVLISTAAEADAPTRYIALFEECPSISRARLEGFLKVLFRLARKHHPDQFTRPAPSGETKRDGKPVMVSYRNRVSLLGHMSEVLVEQIESGKVHGITLETERMEKHAFGEEGYIVPVRASLKLKIEREGRRLDWPMLKSALSIGKKKEYDQARIVFSSTDDKQPHTAILDTESGEVLSDGYVKRRSIAFAETGVADGFNEFQEPIQNGMRDLLTRHRAGE